jgi:hypothetical protein
VKDGAKTAEASPRVQELGKPKSLHPEHKMERSPYTEVSDDAKTAKSNPRLDQLAEPKHHRQDNAGVKETEWGQYLPVSEGAKKAVATPRIEDLSQPKPYNKQFQDERPIQWPVTEEALKAIASLRLQQMARPHSRTMIKDDHDPYRVSLPARRARATPRMEELAVPLPRKVRQKKGVTA